MGRWDQKGQDDPERWADYFDYRPRIEAKGGIKAQSKGGVFGKNWWAKRWIGVLESLNLGARLGRGRSYARKGQVLSIDISEGEVTAKVQGSRSEPYDISIELNPLSESDWRKLATTLSTQAVFVAKLLAGEMPQEIEAGFNDAGLSLFPARHRDLETECSCPDESNPCKHIAAVYYLIGEEFDRDPFLIFKLRGKGREEFIKLLAAEPNRNAAISAKEEDSSITPEPLTSDAAAFWSCGVLPEDFLGEVRVPSVAAALPKRLGNFPFWRGNERFLDALETVYAASARVALEVLGGLGGRPDEAPAKRDKNLVV